VDEATCTTCHVERPHRPSPTVLANQCATCHGPATPAATPVTHIQTRGREAGGGIRPDPILAKDFATITRDMLRVPGGPFILGDDTRHPDEGPMQEWTVGPFYIDRYEVTNADYHRFVKALDRPPPAHWNGHAPPPELADHPVTYVSWYDARDYCAWRGKRLPTEFEWEKAARGAEGLKFPWGDIFDPGIANTPQSKIGHTTPVGRFPKGASPYGAMDMAGNVWEWTDSWYKPYPGNTRSNPNYGEMYRIVRGGSWFDCEFYRCGISAPTFNRGFFIPNTQNDTFGFRCAATAPAAAEAGRRTPP
jgi:formylglycine-generating enzyme required for sulfatase activity